MSGYISYFIFALPGILLSVWASFYTKSTFLKYSRVASRRGYSGAEAAWRMLSAAGITDVTIEATRGFLTDHYDPESRTLRLSQGVFAGRSLSAIGVACHEAGHAIQHAQRYPMLALRTGLVPVTNLCSRISYIFIIAGFFLSVKLILLGAMLFLFAVLFAFITLPVEWNASARAKVAMVRAGIVTESEQVGAGRVLNAAFLTYMAAAVSALMTLLYYLMRAGVIGRRD